MNAESAALTLSVVASKYAGGRGGGGEAAALGLQQPTRSWRVVFIALRSPASPTLSFFFCPVVASFEELGFLFLNQAGLQFGLAGQSLPRRSA